MGAESEVIWLFPAERREWGQCLLPSSVSLGGWVRGAELFRACKEAFQDSSGMEQLYGGKGSEEPDH